MNLTNRQFKRSDRILRRAKLPTRWQFTPSEVVYEKDGDRVEIVDGITSKPQRFVYFYRMVDGIKSFVNVWEIPVRHNYDLCVSKYHISVIFESDDPFPYVRRRFEAVIFDKIKHTDTLGSNSSVTSRTRRQVMRKVRRQILIASKTVILGIRAQLFVLCGECGAYHQRKYTCCD